MTGRERPYIAVVPIPWEALWWSQGPGERWGSNHREIVSAAF